MQNEDKSDDGWIEKDGKDDKGKRGDDETREKGSRR